MKWVASCLLSPGDTQLLQGIPNSAPKQWHTLQRAEKSQTRAEERKEPPNRMFDASVGCKAERGGTTKFVCKGHGFPGT